MCGVELKSCRLLVIYVGGKYVLICLAPYRKMLLYLNVYFNSLRFIIAY